MPLSESHVLVLAAGQGRRMGGPKALMDVAGRPWWRHQAERISRTGMSALWVVSPSVQAAMGASAPITMIVSAADAPMFTSVLAGLRELSSESAASDRPGGVFVLPVDVPAPGRGVFEALSRAHGFAVPVFKGTRGHPVFLPWGLIASRVLVGAETRRLDEIITPESEAIPVDDPAVAANLNRPEDVRHWLDANPREAGVSGGR